MREEGGKAGRRGEEAKMETNADYTLISAALHEMCLTSSSRCLMTFLGLVPLHAAERSIMLGAFNR